MKNLVKIKRALISVSDKSLLNKILSVLSKYKIEIISSGGTFKEIKRLGYKSSEISEFTNFSEMLDGRVKTLHPKIHAGILSIRKNKKHQTDLKKNNYKNIDLVIVNFYPFEKTIKETKNFNKIVENIDIGGPTLVRAAAKNLEDVVVITSPNNYDAFINQINNSKGSTTLQFREQMATYAFNEIANYDSIISNSLNDKFKVSFPHKKTFSGKLIEKLRYGENPHQNAALYSGLNDFSLKKIHGKSLSFNNYNDIFYGLSISKLLKKNTGTVIIKHANPSGVSESKDQIKSFNSAFNCDPISAFGGVISCNYEINKKLANKINNFFFEVIVAEGFKKDALKILKKKKNLRLIDIKNFNNKSNYNFLFNNNTFLYQNSDNLSFDKKNFEVVSKTKPTKNQMNDLIFAFNICKFVRSNAIVICKNRSTLGIGAGQPSRLDSCKIAIEKANTFQPLKIENSVAASDAFFPFPDGPEKLIQAGISAIIQPKGSIRDKEIIKLADKTKTVLVFSKTRHFKH